MEGGIVRGCGATLGLGAGACPIRGLVGGLLDKISSAMRLCSDIIGDGTPRGVGRPTADRVGTRISHVTSKQLRSEGLIRDLLKDPATRSTRSVQNFEGKPIKSAENVRFC